MASTATKVFLIGCIAIVAGIIVILAAGGFFVRSKIKEYTQGPVEAEKTTEQLSKDYPFTPPANGVITENQLQRFLAARKQIFSVYQKYESEFKKLEGKDADFSVLTKGISFFKEVREEHARALAAQRMPPAEYQYIVNSVYKTWAASGTKDALKDKTFEDVADSQLKESIERIDQQLKDPKTPEAAKKALEKTREEFQKQRDKIGENTIVKQMDATLESVPAENLALFKKHEAEIRKYSMAGLELAGL